VASPPIPAPTITTRKPSDREAIKIGDLMTVKLRYRSRILILGKKIYEKDYSRPKGRWLGVAKQYTLFRLSPSPVHDA